MNVASLLSSINACAALISLLGPNRVFLTHTHTPNGAAIFSYKFAISLANYILYHSLHN